MTGRQILELTEARRLVQTGEARRIRVESGLSQAELGGGVGVSAATVSRWENGQRRPTGRAALAYARLLVSIREASS